MNPVWRNMDQTEIACEATLVMYERGRGISVTSSQFLFRMPLLVALLVVMSLTGGCASIPYHYGKDNEYIPPVTAPEKLHIEEGRPNKFIDTLGWIFGIPSKLILWNRRVDNHEISEDTRKAIEDYLDRNELETVKVRLNQYAPGNEFSRIVHNTSVGAGWKYTVGMLGWLFYTILPQRVIGGDNYNPFSNTINLYSDVSAIAVHEGAHAKDFAGRKYKGTYAAAYVFVPFFPLYAEAISSNDAISYLRADGTATEQKEGYKILYPAYGTYVGASVAPFLSSPWNVLAPVLGAIPGHIIGRVKASEIHQDGYNLVDTKQPD
jgi:hypothetical protein